MPKAATIYPLVQSFFTIPRTPYPPSAAAIRLLCRPGHSVGLLAWAAGQRFVFGLAISLLALALVVPSYDVKTRAAWMVPAPVKLLISPVLWR